ncbi:hypothetical protein EVAR_21265_1 [Eumeta japonica]|uniref:Uncharacterized protein n=1 Tax=Eumeta variegata TaxID=151549 RepID=A0A4C1WPV8_EUMVA|nr:hypothetical protein EVAR_21265_1 [Eumeta japonica]
MRVQRHRSNFQRYLSSASRLRRWRALRVAELASDTAVCSVTTAVVWARPHDPLSWSALGGVAYDVRHISYRAFLCVALYVTASGNTCEAFRGVHFSLIFNFTNSPQSVLIVFVLRGRRSGVGLNFYCRLFYRHGGAALVGYLIQKVDNITSSGSSLF